MRARHHLYCRLGTRKRLAAIAGRGARISLPHEVNGTRINGDCLRKRATVGATHTHVDLSEHSSLAGGKGKFRLADAGKGRFAVHAPGDRGSVQIDRKVLELKLNRALRFGTLREHEHREVAAAKRVGLCVRREWRSEEDGERKKKDFFHHAAFG